MSDVNLLDFRRPDDEPVRITHVIIPGVYAGRVEDGPSMEWDPTTGTFVL